MKQPTIQFTSSIDEEGITTFKYENLKLLNESVVKRATIKVRQNYLKFYNPYRKNLNRSNSYAADYIELDGVVVKDVRNLICDLTHLKGLFK